MPIGKVVVLMRRVEPESWDALMAEKPAGWQVTLVNPDDGEQKVAKELKDAQSLVALGGRISSKVLETAG
ncbi:hypothetical protein ACFLV8_01760 [Chloroflexota bacterium]